MEKRAWLQTGMTSWYEWTQGLALSLETELRDMGNCLVDLNNYLYIVVYKDGALIYPKGQTCMTRSLRTYGFVASSKHRTSWLLRDRRSVGMLTSMLRPTESSPAQRPRTKSIYSLMGKCACVEMLAQGPACRSTISCQGTWLRALTTHSLTPRRLLLLSRPSTN